MAEYDCPWCKRTVYSGHLCFLKGNPDNDNFEWNLDYLDKIAEMFAATTINKDSTDNNFGHSNPALPSQVNELLSSTESHKNFSTTKISGSCIDNSSPIPQSFIQCHRHSLGVPTSNSFSAPKNVLNDPGDSPVNPVNIAVETAQGNVCRADNIMSNPIETVSSQNDSVWFTGTRFKISRATCFEIDNETHSIRERDERYLDSITPSLRCSESIGNASEPQKQKGDINIRHTSEDITCTSDCSNSYINTNRFAAGEEAVSFGGPSGVNTHFYRTCKEKTFVCKVCRRAFRLKGNLNQHSRTHTGEKPFVCPMCGKGFCSKSNMVTHRLIHTGEKPFECSICPKKFNQKINLKKHIMTHTGEKPFLCEMCGKGFAENSELLCHRLNQTGDESFGCPVCPKKCNRKFNLKTHMRIHTKEYPFVCLICGMKLAYNSN